MTVSVPPTMSLQKAQSKWADLMAVFWVQQYFTLPVIFEHPGMGDEPSHRHQPALTELSGTDHAGKYNSTNPPSCLTENAKKYRPEKILLILKPSQLSSRQWSSTDFQLSHSVWGKCRAHRYLTWAVWRVLCLTTDRLHSVLSLSNRHSICKAYPMHPTCIIINRVLSLPVRPGPITNLLFLSNIRVLL